MLLWYNTGVRAHRHTQATPHTFTPSSLPVFTVSRATDGRGKKKGESATKYLNAVGLGSLATNIPPTGVTCLPNTHWRNENGDLRMYDLWKEAWYPSWHIDQSSEGIPERWEACMPRQHSKSVSVQNLSYVTCPKHLKQPCSPGPSRVTGTDGQFLNFPDHLPHHGVKNQLQFHLRPVEGDTEEVTSLTSCHLDVRYFFHSLNSN